MIVHKEEHLQCRCDRTLIAKDYTRKGSPKSLVQLIQLYKCKNSYSKGFTVTAKLICVFVFTFMQKTGFLMTGHNTGVLSGKTFFLLFV